MLASPAHQNGPRASGLELKIGKQCLIDRTMRFWRSELPVPLYCQVALRDAMKEDLEI